MNEYRDKYVSRKKCCIYLCDKINALYLMLKNNVQVASLTFNSL